MFDIITDSEVYRNLKNEELMNIILDGDAGQSATLLLQSPNECYCSAIDFANKANISNITNARKALAIAELLKRKKKKKENKDIALNSSKEIYDYAVSEFIGLDHEELSVIFLNTSNKVLKHIRFSVGGIKNTTFDIRLILKNALLLSAVKLVLLHNHPSGSTSPSINDIGITTSLKEGAKLLDIALIDHIIITNNEYYSFADNNNIL